jgi:hypothetical protein
MTRARVPVAVFALWLLASWTVPVCCFPANMAAMDHAALAGMTGMAGHHHHSSAAASHSSTRRLSSSESCTQTWDTTAVAALAPRTSWSTEDHSAAASICNLQSPFLQLPINLQSALYNLQLSPPGHTSALSVSLRI